MVKKNNQLKSKAYNKDKQVIYQNVNKKNFSQSTSENSYYEDDPYYMEEIEKER